MTAESPTPDPHFPYENLNGQSCGGNKLGPHFEKLDAEIWRLVQTY